MTPMRANLGAAKCCVRLNVKELQNLNKTVSREVLNIWLCSIDWKHTDLKTVWAAVWSVWARYTQNTRQETRRSLKPRALLRSCWQTCFCYFYKAPSETSFTSTHCRYLTLLAASVFKTVIFFTGSVDLHVLLNLHLLWNTVWLHEIRLFLLYVLVFLACFCFTTTVGLIQPNRRGAVLQWVFFRKLDGFGAHREAHLLCLYVNLNRSGRSRTLIGVNSRFTSRSIRERQRKLFMYSLLNITLCIVFCKIDILHAGHFQSLSALNITDRM